MKLKTKRNKRSKALIVIAIVLIAIALAIGIGLIVYKTVDDVQSKEMSFIDFSVYPTKRSYYVGETFDPSGIQMQAVAKNGSSTYISDPKQLEFSGFDSSEPCEKQWITVTYMGVSAQFDIAIIEPPKPTPTLERIEVYGLQTEYRLTYWNFYGVDNSGGRIRCIYSDGSIVEDIPLLYEYISKPQTVDSPGTTYITVQYSDGVTMVETQVEITITE